MPTYLTPGVISFEALIQLTGRGGGAYVEFPHSVEELFGVKGRVPVQASFDGVPYRGSLMKMGGDCHVIGILKGIREQLGKGAGDAVRVTVELDTAERTIEIPQDVRDALVAAGRLDAFEALAFTHRREHLEAIEDAKRPPTRARRIERLLDALQR